MFIFLIRRQAERHRLTGIVNLTAIFQELNGQMIKLVKFQGPFTWHHHENEDELFFVVAGRFRMEYREDGVEKSVWIEPGEMIVVPRGMEHRPVADEECHVVLFEPVSTLNTGNTENELTRKELSVI